MATTKVKPVISPPANLSSLWASKDRKRASQLVVSGSSTAAIESVAAVVALESPLLGQAPVNIINDDAGWEDDGDQLLAGVPDDLVIESHGKKVVPLRQMSEKTAEEEAEVAAAEQAAEQSTRKWDVKSPGSDRVNPTGEKVLNEQHFPSLECGSKEKPKEEKRVEVTPFNVASQSSEKPGLARLQMRQGTSRVQDLLAASRSGGSSTSTASRTGGATAAAPATTAAPVAAVGVWTGSRGRGGTAPRDWYVAAPADATAAFTTSNAFATLQTQ